MNSKLKKFSVYPPVMMLSLSGAVFSYMIPIIKEIFSMNYKQAGAVQTVQSVGGFFAQLVCFGVFAALNKSRVVIASLVIVALSLMWIGFNRAVPLLYVLFFIRGLFGNVGNTMSNALVTDVFDARKEFFVGLYHSLAALTAVVGPYLALWLSDFTVTFEVMAVVIGLTAVLYLFGMRDYLKKPMIANRENFGGLGKLLRMLKHKNMVIVLFIVLFCSFVQNTVVLYISSFGLELNSVMQEGAFALSMYLFGLFLGSLLYSVAANKISTISIMLVGNILGFGALLVMLLSHSAMAVGILALAGGVFLGPNIPGLFVELSKMVPEDSGAVSALLFLGAILSVTAAPIIVGAIADEMGIRLAMISSLVFFIPVLLLIFVLRRRYRKDFIYNH